MFDLPDVDETKSLRESPFRKLERPGQRTTISTAKKKYPVRVSMPAVTTQRNRPQSFDGEKQHLYGSRPVILLIKT